jgi:hypothetical protein
MYSYRIVKHSDGVNMTKVDFPRTCGEAYLASHTAENSISGFRKSGIWPFNREAIPEGEFTEPQRLINDDDHVHGLLVTQRIIGHEVTPEPYYSEAEHIITLITPPRGRNNHQHIDLLHSAKKAVTGLLTIIGAAYATNSATKAIIDHQDRQLEDQRKRRIFRDLPRVNISNQHHLVFG